MNRIGRRTAYALLVTWCWRSSGRCSVAVGSPIALQRVRGARWRGFVLISQLLLSQVPKFIFPTFGPAGFFPKLVRSRVDLLFARFWHYISASWSTAPPSGG